MGITEFPRFGAKEMFAEHFNKRHILCGAHDETKGRPWSRGALYASKSVRAFARDGSQRKLLTMVWGPTPLELAVFSSRALCTVERQFCTTNCGVSSGSTPDLKARTIDSVGVPSLQKHVTQEQTSIAVCEVRPQVLFGLDEGEAHSDGFSHKDLFRDASHDVALVRRHGWCGLSMPKYVCADDEIDFFEQHTMPSGSFMSIKPKFNMEDIGLKLVNLSIHIYDLVMTTDRTWRSILTRVHAIMMILGLDKEAYRWLVEDMLGLFSRTPVRPETLEGLGEAIGKDAAKFISSNLTKIVEKMIKFCSAAMVAPALMQNKGQYLKNIGYVLDKAKLSSFGAANLTVEAVVGMLAHCITRGLEFFVNASFPDEVNTLLKQSTVLRASVEECLLVMDCDTREDMLRDLNGMATQLTNMHLSMRGDRFTVAQALLHELELVLKLKARTSQCGVSSDRVQAPLSLNIVGDPAIGKSEITNTLIDIIASIKNGGTYYQPNQRCKASLSKYWNNLTNESKIVIFDDLNASVRAGEKTESTHGKWAEGLIQMVNNCQFLPELAEAHLKGKIQPVLHAVISTSNEENKYGNIPGMGNKEAVFRRFHMIKCVLKNEFKTPEGKFDVAAVRAAGDTIYDVNPWKMCFLKFNLKKSQEKKKSDKVDNNIDDALWEPITFMYEGEQRLSDDMTFDMFKALFTQLYNVENDAGTTLREMNMNLQRRLFPDMFMEQVVPDGVQVDPQVLRISRGLRLSSKDWYLTKTITLAARGGLLIQMLCLLLWPMTSLWWSFFRMLYWRPPSWRPNSNRQGFRDYIMDGYDAVKAQQKILLLCCGFTIATTSASLLKTLLESVDLDMGQVFRTVMFGGEFVGLLREAPTQAANQACGVLRDGCTMTLYMLADKERQARFKRVLRNGIFTGVAIGTLIQITKWIARYRTISMGLQDKLGSSPVTAETTVNSEGVINVQVDRQVDAAPRHKQWLGSYHTLPRVPLAKAMATQTPDESRQKMGATMYRMTIEPCKGSQLTSVERFPEHKADMFVVGYTRTKSVTYMITVAHAFARDYSHFCITIHDPSRVAKECVLPRADIVFAPRSLYNGTMYDVDLCMFEVPNNVTGDLPCIHKHLGELQLGKTSNLVRMIPTCGDNKGVIAVEQVPASYVDMMAFTYTDGTPANKLLPSPIALFMSGDGADGMCGSIIMSGGVVVGIHTGSNKPTGCVTATPITDKMLAAMKARMLDKQAGHVPNYDVENMLIRFPYVNESPNSKLTIEPTVKIVDPGALSRIAYDRFFNAVGTLKRKDGSDVSVKATTSLGFSPHIDMMFEYIPDAARLMSEYGIPSKYYKMRHTVERFVDKCSMERPDDVHLRRLAQHAVGHKLYQACSEVITSEPGLAQMQVLGMQAGLDGLSSSLSSARFNLGSAIPLNTSVGPSYPGAKSEYLSKVFSPEHGRFFTCFEEDNPISMEIMDRVRELKERRARGEVGFSMNFMCPKDEVLPVQDNGLTKPPRHIMNGELADNILTRMYFQPILVLLGYNPLSCGHSVGMDPTMNYLDMMKSLVNGDVEKPLYAHQVEASAFVATDYSGFDLSLSGGMLSAVMNIIINLSNLLNYSDEDRVVMSSIAYDLCNPSVVMLGTVVRLAGVNTSGNPLTTIINCVANMIINCQIHTMIRYDVLHGKYMVDYTRDYSTLTVSDMQFDLRRIVAYGDDVVVRVEKGSPINQPASIYYGGLLGYVITGSDKGKSVTEYATDFTFLKRKFHMYVRPADGQVVMCLAPLAMDSIFKPFVWGDFGKVDICDHYTGLVKSALHELVQHGEQVYEDLVPRLWSFTKNFSIEKKIKKGKITLKSGIASRFEGDFVSWETAIRRRYAVDLDRIEGELTLSELKLIEL